MQKVWQVFPQFDSDGIASQVKADKHNKYENNSGKLFRLISIYWRNSAVEDYCNTNPLRLIDEMQAVFRFFVVPRETKSSTRSSMQLSPSSPKKP